MKHVFSSKKIYIKLIFIIIFVWKTQIFNVNI